MNNQELISIFCFDLPGHPLKVNTVKTFMWIFGKITLSLTCSDYSLLPSRDVEHTGVRVSIKMSEVNGALRRV